MKGPILLVEDDTILRERLTRALIARGVEVVACRNGAEATGAFRAGQFQGAVLDLRLPDTSGLSLVTEFRRRDPAIRIIVLTGFGSIATAMEAVRLGATDFLSKPTDAESLLAAFRGEPRGARNPEPGVTEVPTLDRVEWEHIQRVLTECGGNISQTARLLGLDRRSLQRKLAKYPPRT